MPGSEHLSDVEIAAYLDRTLSATDRDRVEDHLAECPDCRRQMLETKELLEKMRRPKKVFVGGAAAAAVVLIFLIARPDVLSLRQPTRASGSESEQLAVYGPLGAAPRAGLRFVWAASPKAESYRLSASGVDGELLWSWSGTDTIATLPDSVRLIAGKRYVWVVDALLADGTTRSTGLRQIDVVP
jgi:anti-sigma factor RsiW